MAHTTKPHIYYNAYNSDYDKSSDARIIMINNSKNTHTHTQQYIIKLTRPSITKVVAHNEINLTCFSNKINVSCILYIYSIVYDHSHHLDANHKFINIANVNHLLCILSEIL